MTLSCAGVLMLPFCAPPLVATPPLPYLSLFSLLQRLVEAAEEAHLQHEEDPELQVRRMGGGAVRLLTR